MTDGKQGDLMTKADCIKQGLVLYDEKNQPHPLQMPDAVSRALKKWISRPREVQGE